MSSRPRQGGDQFLDGIGETSLVGPLRRSTATPRTRRATSSTRRSAAPRASSTTRCSAARCCSPATAATCSCRRTRSTAKTPSPSPAWLFLPTGASGPVFDFGRDAANRLFATASRDGLRASAVVERRGRRATTAGSAVAENQWLHFAVVLDPARARADAATSTARGSAQAANVTATATQILPHGASASLLPRPLAARTASRRCTRGCATCASTAIALSDQQVATIRTNALPGPSHARAGAARRRRRSRPPTFRANRRSRRELSHVPDITVDTVVGMLPRLPATVPATYSRRQDGTGRARDLAVRRRTTAQVAAARLLHGHRPRARHVVRAEGDGDRQGAGRPHDAAEPPRRSRFRSATSCSSRTRRDAPTPFIRNRDKFIRGLAASNPGQLPLQLPGRVRPAAAGGRAAARRVGQPDDEAARACERPLPVGDRAGVCEHDLRQGAAGELPAEDELPDRHAVRPVAEVGQAGDSRAGRRSPIRRRCRRGRAGTATTRTCAPARSAPTTGTGARASSARIRPTSSSCWRRARPTARRTRRSGRRITRCTRSSPGCSTATKSAATRRRSRSRKGMGAWANARLKALPPETRISMWNRYIAGEYGGMNEVMARLFRLTGDRRFLETREAVRQHQRSSSATPTHERGLAKNVDTIRGKHANQHIPQITGALETFRNTQELPYYQIAVELLEHRQRQLHVQHRRRGRRAQRRTTPSASRRSRTRCGRTASRTAARTRPAPPTTC